MRKRGMFKKGKPASVAKETRGGENRGRNQIFLNLPFMDRARVLLQCVNELFIWVIKQHSYTHSIKHLHS